MKPASKRKSYVKDLLREFKYSVQTSDINRLQCYEWLNDNFGRCFLPDIGITYINNKLNAHGDAMGTINWSARWDRYLLDKDIMVFIFRNEADAILFKLRWA